MSCNKWSKLVAGTLVAVVLSGAASAQNVQRGDPQLRAQVVDYNRTVFEGALAGALIGAATGALVGALSGNRNAGQGAILGGLGGLFGGLAGGVAVAEDKKQQAANEGALNSKIAQAAKFNRQLAGIVQTADQLVAQRRSEFAAAQVADARAKERLKATIIADEQQIDAAIAHARKLRDELAADVQARKDTEANISSLDTKKRALGSIRRQI